ncbi:MAG: FAD-dependent oxidoreductase, partial [Myxococcota bacterium]|nr:FAD-dependent oxidoreductase [Myxococcota bacterium]
VGVLEQHAEGHAHGSSHGVGRVTRSTYVHPTYVRLMSIAHGQEWPALEEAIGEALIHRTGGCIFGPPDGAFHTYAAAVETGGVAVEHLSPADARERLPCFRFGDDDGVLWDPTAGVVKAHATMAGLVRVCTRSGVDLRWGTKVTHIDPGGSNLRVQTTNGILQTRKLVVTAGAWAGSLIPQVRPALTVVRQSVAYMSGGDPALFSLGSMPPWVWLGGGENGVFYGLPSHDGEEVKIGWHRVVGSGDDPDELGATPDPEVGTRTERQAARLFSGAPQRLSRLETCLYTLTDDEDYILDTLPGDPRVVIGAGFSGHGFKLAPVTGRILAQLAVRGSTDVEPYEADRDRFAIVNDAEPPTL